MARDGHIGTASGVLSTAQQVGGSVGVAYFLLHPLLLRIGIR